MTKYQVGDVVRWRSFTQVAQGRISKVGIFHLFYLIEYKEQWDTGWPFYPMIGWKSKGQIIEKIGVKK